MKTLFVLITIAVTAPLCAEPPILFVTRHQYAPDHHNTETFFQTGEINTIKYRPGGALRVLDPKTKEVRTILDAGPTGLVRDPEVSFDGKRILFSMRKSIADDTHIYEINADGTGLRQLTFAKGVSDIDPLYLPDDSIVFTSTREPKYCMCNRHIMGNIFRMEADGANIHQIGKSTLHEGHASLMPDGRILYDRWEYVDRNFGDAQALWTVNPDGTQHAIFWGSNVSSPGGVIDGRAVPGTPYTLAIFCACHDRPWGALALLDRRQGVDTRESVIRTWPAAATNLFKTGGFDSNKALMPKYEDPYPLDDKRFLVSRQMTPGSEQMGIYLLDLDGNETLLHSEPELGCFDPMPLAPRPRPPVIPTRRDYRNKTGTFYVQDVYTGTHMDGVKQGDVKWLRVVESPEKRSWSHACWFGQGAQAPAMNWHNFENKRILGTVPVESDGSAYFEVPADRYVFFQLLDEKMMMIQSMRTGTIIQSGETQGCVGCHENRTAGLVPSNTSIAMSRAPSKLDGWHGPPRDFDFLKEVQPVLTKHCARCHDYGKKLVLVPDRDFVFNAAYIELWSKKIITCVGAGPAEIQPAKSWGSHVSRLIQVLRQGHPSGTGILPVGSTKQSPSVTGRMPVPRLSPEELDRLITWVDLNAPFYASYLTAFPDNLTGRCPLDNAQLKRLAQLTGVDLKKHDSHDSLKQPWISFDRPELSPILAGVTNGLAEAVAIIRDGQRKLKDEAICAADKARDEKYEQRAAVEWLNRKAIAAGQKVYD